MIEKIRPNESATSLPKAETPPSPQIEEVREQVREKLEQKDRFLENPPRQPKKEIADMLEARGILVPRRFENLADALEAIRQGREIVARSEHPQEYASAAGLLDSHVLGADKMAKGKAFCDEKGSKIDWDNFYEHFGRADVEHDAKNRIFGSLETTDQATFEDNLKKLSLPHVRRYCELLGLDVDKFTEGISYSYWEKIDGQNRSIVADSAIPGRYHVFTTEGYNYHNYAIVDNGQIVLDKPMVMTAELKAGLEEVIAFYEKIRNTEGFDPAHCPLIEFQTQEDQNYFLQYHRTRDMKPCSWQLDRELEEGEFEATFVRGATSPEGTVLNVAMYYPRERATAETNEDGSFDFHYDHIFSEVMSRRRVANFDNKSLYKLSVSCIDAHLPKSKLFNPQISISISDDNLPPDLPEKMFQQTKESGKPATIKVRVVSDGRKAYIKFLE